jgi:hypothetical protein
MKKTAPFFIAFTGIFSINCFAQLSQNQFSNAKIENLQLNAEIQSEDKMQQIVSYHVEERINMNFGSRITTYEVSDLSLVSQNDLGPNNVRIVTPKLLKVKNKKSNTTIETKSTEVIPIKATPNFIEKKKEFVTIDVGGTFERILEKGYQSVDMLKKVGDRRFFGGDLKVSAKWYSQLFEITKDLESVYYYRFAQSLKSIGELDKANEMMKIFESKSL